MAETQDKKRERCKLHAALGLEAWCTHECCIYWRLLEAQDMELSNEQGCGLHYHKIVQDVSPEIAAWLLEMKKKLENTTPEAGKSRITFKRREKE